MYLAKYLSQCGICSRRKATELVRAGFVTVNGCIVKNPAYEVKGRDLVEYEGKKIKEEKKVYIILNKPKGYVTSVSDERGRATVMDLIKVRSKERLYPVGRLDRDTAGLLLITNDGALAQRLAHPKNVVKKVYHVSLDRPLKSSDLIAIKRGIRLKDGRVKPDKIYCRLQNKRVVSVEIHIGKKRIVRRIFEHFDYKVLKLDRVNYASLTKKGLRAGFWRYLTLKEVESLKSVKRS